MEKTIKIGDQEVKFKATGGTTRRYRERFNKDLFSDINELSQHFNSGNALGSFDLECFENIAYIMAKQADDTIPDNPDEWLDQFEMLDIYEVLPQIAELWARNKEEIAEAKKKV